ncbi:HAD-IA family hydrolase [Ancylobacter defluvii]|uniref:Glycerol-3-phosphatase n=1 Tax=Ancylobacter defluvii TaxID=1282440 RepID=A0A9W6NAY6_9HYPH|nr:HAD-IA family hydrolase [Ancylobacter defluvii]GLK84133.1 glycerol-3-phosphatase [Ancylobacter defluvii]
MFDRNFGAFLFDMDGTVLTSIAAAERVWTRWAQRHGLDVARFLPTIHGVQAVDTVRRQAPNLPGIDIAAETAWVTQAEIEDVDGIAPIPGAVAFLAALPPERWTIVTSATRELAAARLRAAGLPPPARMVCAEDITRGKPEPDGYLLAAERLGVRPEDCLIFEDAPAGIAAGEAAGGTVLVITQTHHQPLETTHATVHDYLGLAATVAADGSLRLTCHTAGDRAGKGPASR